MNKQQIELGLKIKKLIGTEDMEDSLYKHEMDGHVYDLKEVHDNGWDDEGKYQHRQLVSEVIEDGEPTGILLSQITSRSGSYYSDYYYDHHAPELVRKEEKVIKVTNYVPLKNK